MDYVRIVNEVAKRFNRGDIDGAVKYLERSMSGSTISAMENFKIAIEELNKQIQEMKANHNARFGNLEGKLRQESSESD